MRRRTLTVIVPAHGSVVQALTPGAVGAADAALVGVEVRSDLPLLSQRDVRPASGAPGATTGVDTPRVDTARAWRLCWLSYWAAWRPAP